MNRKEIIIAALLLLLAPATAQAQVQSCPIDRIGVRTNLASWVLASPSLGVDVQWGGRWQATLDGHLSLLSTNRGGGHARYPRLSGFGAEVRRYFGRDLRGVDLLGLGVLRSPLLGSDDAYRGLYLALDARYTQFDCLPASAVGREGIAYTVGYTLALPSLWGLNTENWTVDAAIGIGYVYRDLNRYAWYAPARQNRLLGAENGSAFGVTHAELSLVYHFNL